jgi:hypothetical protein
MLLGPGTRAPSPDQDLDLDGRAPTAEELQPSVEAAFNRESYAPGTTARLVVFGSARGVELRIFHTGPEHTHTVGNDELQGPAGRAADATRDGPAGPRGPRHDRGLAERPLFRPPHGRRRPRGLRTVRRPAVGLP